MQNQFIKISEQLFVTQHNGTAKRYIQVQWNFDASQTFYK